MRVTVNGTSRQLPGRSTVQEVVVELTTASRGVAVAVNGTVLPRTQWTDTVLRDGDRLEVLLASQGG